MAMSVQLVFGKYLNNTIINFDQFFDLCKRLNVGFSIDKSLINIVAMKYFIICIIFIIFIIVLTLFQNKSREGALFGGQSKKAKPTLPTPIKTFPVVKLLAGGYKGKIAKIGKAIKSQFDPNAGVVAVNTMTPQTAKPTTKLTTKPPQKVTQITLPNTDKSICNSSYNQGMTVSQSSCFDLTGQVADSAKLNAYIEKLNKLKAMLVPILNLYNNPELFVKIVQGETGRDIPFQATINDINYNISYDKGLIINENENPKPQTITFVVPKGPEGPRGPKGNKGPEGKKGSIGDNGSTGASGLYIK